MVYNTLAGLMTPVMPPFYKIFMSGMYDQACVDISEAADNYILHLLRLKDPEPQALLVGSSTGPGHGLHG